MPPHASERFPAHRKMAMMPWIRWRVLALLAWNAGLLLRLYHGGSWDLPILFQFVGLFASVMGSYTIVTTPLAHKIEGFILGGLLLLVTGIPHLVPSETVPNVLWVASGMATVLGLVAIYLFIFRGKRTYLIQDHDH